MHGIEEGKSQKLEMHIFIPVDSQQMATIFDIGMQTCCIPQYFGSKDKTLDLGQRECKRN